MNINFLRLWYFNTFFIFILCILSVFLIFYNKFDVGLDFTSGMELEIEYVENIDIEDLKNTFKGVRDIKIKYYGSKRNVQIRIKKTEKEKSDVVNSIRELINNKGKIVKIEYIGASVSQEIINRSCIAVLTSIISMFIYLVVRFNLKFACSAIFTLFFDLITTLSLISILNLELNLTVCAALFAVFGYSVNDTIVIFDRIRENAILCKGANSLEIINVAVNNTLSRTVSTSLSTLLVVIIILIFGGEYLFGFALTLFCGIIIGTYSSIFIAPSFLVLLKFK